MLRLTVVVLLGLPILGNSQSTTSFLGIALGDQATELIKKYNINPARANTLSGSCELQAAQAIVGCVWHVANCPTNRLMEDCPEKDYCATAEQVQKRKDHNTECQEYVKKEMEGRQKLNAWLKGSSHIILRKRFVCLAQESFKKAYNLAYRGATAAALNFMESNGCIVIGADTRAKILKFSDDNKLVFIELQAPNSTSIIKGVWTHPEFVITKEQFKAGLL
ncbi:MAG: hypothetical protein A2270_03035 [Elusimicrobia bacterium RIFOXYA12_FULL_51_18]|nr:MAG: hypothetical protein A2270_03035 [Elusimicrobia bacterium RIFOXYA12_FULL_51_18]OGS28379.1 MAG: hypothetical protein A2218_06855 [Elusimicrobia bacterium RIFOXYA2_FULL_53_38]